MNTVHHNGTTPQPMSPYDWETDTHSHTTAMDAAQLWRTAVAIAATNARQALPDSNGRIDKAIELVLSGAVELLDDGTARVTSQHNGDTAYLICNGTCDCLDFARAPSNFCKHRLARGIAIRATQHAKELGQTSPAVTLGPDDLENATAADVLGPVQAEGTPALTIPQQFLVEIQGKQFVTFHGLLHLAYALPPAQRLQSLTAEFISVTAELALASATATFADGRTFTEAADSTPSNVNARIKPHFPRMALTRAKARALRDALNLAYVCAEELD